MSRIIRVLGIAAILLSLAAGTVSASEESGPGPWFWNLKVRFENMRFGIEDKLQRVRDMTQARVEAAAGLAGESLPTRLQNGLCVEDCATGPFLTRTQAGTLGPNDEPAGIGPIGPGPGPGEPQAAQLQDGSNNQGPEQNQNQEPVDGDPNENSGGDNGGH